jgi:hypothetical protein
MQHRRFAIYYVPRPSRLADATAAWLGWDCQSGRAVAPVAGMPKVPPGATDAPRPYGFHGTLKAPFRLAPGRTLDELDSAVATLAGDLAPVILPAMHLRQLAGFLALTPAGGEAGLSDLAAKTVRRLDPFRAPLTADEIARRQPQRLTVSQRDHLDRWGYPHVMEDFLFHLTLTGHLQPELAQDLTLALKDWLMPLVPRPFPIEDLCLVGEATDGRFHLLSRHALMG